MNLASFLRNPASLRNRIEAIRGDLAKAEDGIKAQQKVINECSFDAYNGDARAAKRMKVADAERLRLERQARNLSAALTEAQDRLASAEATEAEAARLKRRNALLAELDAREGDAAAIQKACRDLLEAVITMDERASRIDQLRLGLPKRANNVPEGALRELRRELAGYRVRDYLTALELDRYFIVKPTAMADRRPLVEVEADIIRACRVQLDEILPEKSPAPADLSPAVAR